MRKTVVFENKKLEKGIRAWEGKGWQVVSITPQDRSYGCLKTGCLGLLFLPLALLGKKPGKTMVIFSDGRN